MDLTSRSISQENHKFKRVQSQQPFNNLLREMYAIGSFNSFRPIAINKLEQRKNARYPNKLPSFFPKIESPKETKYLHVSSFTIPYDYADIASLKEKQELLITHQTKLQMAMPVCLKLEQHIIIAK